MQANWPRRASLEDAAAWVEALSAEEKVELAAQAKRFDDLARIRRAGTTANARSRNQPTAGRRQLQKTLLAYGQWLSRLTAGRQEELREDLLDRPIDEQVDRVRRFVRQEHEQASRQLSTEDAEKLRNECWQSPKNARPSC